MQYPERFQALLGYPFPRLRALLKGIEADGDPVRLSLGEPKHPFPSFLTDEICANAALFNSYPINNGMPALNEAITGYFARRFHVDGLSAKNITPVNGTREGLYMSALSLFPEEKQGKAPLVLLPNPFYQVYMMGARTLGIETKFLDCTAETEFLPDLDNIATEDWARCVAFFICSPANPQGAVASPEYLERLIALAEQHDFLVMADECYSEIYFDEPPASALQVAHEMGADLNRVVAFHSLSKRSNAPGLRSGFIASGEATTTKLQQLRGYAGAPIPGPIQMASAKLWSDDAHVEANRALYAEKNEDARALFGDALTPAGGFFLWLPVEDGEAVTRELWQAHQIEVLPGAYLAADGAYGNPGENFIRVALVEDRAKTKPALHIIANYIKDKNRGRTWH